MKIKWIKYIISICLAASLMIVPANVSYAAAEDVKTASALSTEDDAVIADKEEVIYASLASDGNVSRVYAVNHFDVTGAGTVKDQGKYSSLVNLTNTDLLKQEGDTVSFHAGEGNFYYQGNMTTTDLPWTFEISYYLDGVKTEPGVLSGKSGKIEIRMATKANEKIDPTFYQNYMLQITLKLDTGKCANITAPDAVLANSGETKIIAYTVMPGKNADISVTADVHDFAMGGIGISGMPFTMGIEIPDTTSIVDDMSALPTAIDSLNDGVKDLADGVSAMSEGSGKLASGSNDFADGLSQINGKSAQLTAASSQINKALSDITASMAGSGGGINMDDLSKLPTGLASLAQGLDDISGGLTDLKTGYSSAYTALDSAIVGIPEDEISESDINALYGTVTDPDQQVILGQLIDYYSSARTVKGTYAQVQAAFASVETSLDTMSGSIDTISASLSDIAAQMGAALSGGSDFTSQIQQLAEGLSALSAEYGQFDTGLVQYTDGVGTLAAGYKELNTGTVSLSDGIDELNEGTQELYQGTKKLNDNVAGLPEQMQAQIDTLMQDYDKSDFKPVSFTSAINPNISLVQFVIMTAEIKPEEKSATVEPAVKDVTIWDRFLLLFR